MSNPLSRPVALMLFLALALSTTVLAQTAETADVSGVVLDASGRPVAGYPMNIVTSQWGKVIMHPTEDDGTFAVNGLPPGSYELRVFEPGGSTENPVASKQVTLAAGQAERIEIRLGSGNPGGAAASKSAAGSPATESTLASMGINGTAVVIAAMVLVAALVVFLVVRSQRGPAS